MSAYLFDDRDPAPAATQPVDAEEVDNPDPEPIPYPVFGSSVAPLPVGPVDMGDRQALADDEGRDEAVPAVEIGQTQEDVPRKRLEAAAGIARAVGEHGAAHRVGDARGKALEGRIGALGALALRQAAVRSG